MPKDWKEEVERVNDLMKKSTAAAHIGGWTIMLKDVTFTKRQIKHYKKYFNIDVENLEDK